jgi:hypothetical protein
MQWTPTHKELVILWVVVWTFRCNWELWICVTKQFALIFWEPCLWIIKNRPDNHSGFDAILIPTQHWYVLEMESVSVWGGRMCYVVVVWQVQHFDAKYLIYCSLRFWHNH